MGGLLGGLLRWFIGRWVTWLFTCLVGWFVAGNLFVCLVCSLLGSLVGGLLVEWLVG